MATFLKATNEMSQKIFHVSTGNVHRYRTPYFVVSSALTYKRGFPLAVTGIKPTGTRHVVHTSLMWMARLALLAVLIIVGYMAFRARSGG
jgi:hypothetical protein